MTKENRAEFDYVACVYVLPFAKRWKQKVRRTKRIDEKQYEFDSFIANYIIYAALVNVIKPHDFKTKMDREYCTEVMADFILDNSPSVDFLINNLQGNVRHLGEVIVNNNLTVVSSKNENPELDTKWKLNDDRDKLLSLLQSLYYLRCNLFHGSKEFADEQVELLSCANKCLETMNNEIVGIFKNYTTIH